MITTAEASLLIEDLVRPLPAIEVPLDDAVGRVLAEPVRADRPFPPYDRVMMDGVAGAAAALASLAPGTPLPVTARATAGAPRVALASPGGVVAVSTGAILPLGTDCVVPVEELERDGDRVRLAPGARVAAGRFVHRAGSDHAAGEPVVAAGTRLSSRTLAIAAAAGMATVRVARPPRVAILATGDELVPLGQPVGDHQLRPSNLHALVGGLRAAGAEVVLRELVEDEPAAVEAALARARAAADVTLVTGGLSKGERDHVPARLRALGAEIHLHGVRQRPGRPFLAAAWPEGGLVFGLPGNPVSTLTCFHRFVLPVLDQMQGLPAPAPRYAVLAEPYAAPVALTIFLPVRLEPRRDGVFAAFALPASNSGDLGGLGESDGFLELPGEEIADYPPGYVGRVFPWR